MVQAAAAANNSMAGAEQTPAVSPSVMWSIKPCSFLLPRSIITTDPEVAEESSLNNREAREEWRVHAPSVNMSHSRSSCTLLRTHSESHG